MDVIPSIFSQQVVGQLPFYDGDLFSNIKLRQGQVVRKIDPTSPDSVSKKFFEYDVVVSQYESGTLGHRKYHNCLLINPLAGAGDKLKFTLRESQVPIGGDEKGSVDPYPATTNGSRVLILCVEGSNNQAIVLGGLRDERNGGDDPQKGHHLEFEFNGVNFQINDDGSWTFSNTGKTDNLGKPHKDRNEGAGTLVKVEANGNFIIATPESNQTVVIDNANKTISIKGDKDVTIEAKTIHCGAGASQPGVLGLELVSILQEVLTAISTMTMSSIAGNPLPLTSPPVNAAQFAAISSKLNTILSNQTYLKK